MEAVVLDLETTDLSAVGSGWVVCAVVKPLGKPPEVFRYDELSDKPGREKKLLRRLIARLEDHDLWIGQNIIGLDWPYLKSRAVVLDLPIPRSAFVVDTMQCFKYLGLRSAINPKTGRPKAGLGHIVDFFGLPQEKTVVGFPRATWKAVWGSESERRQTVQAIVDHCVEDARMTEGVYYKLLKHRGVPAIPRLK